MPRIIDPTCCIVLTLVLFPGFAVLRADEPAKPADLKAPTREELIKNLETTLTGAKLSGRFTVRGKEDMAPSAEEYTISSAKKLPNEDYWLIAARIKYGKIDAVVPIPLEIKWAGDTPVITLSKTTIPGLGTFSARVVIYEGQYAGTWQHDEVGGYLFGTIEKAEEKKPEEEGKGK